jgi:hypothetical protein
LTVQSFTTGVGSGFHEKENRCRFLKSSGYRSFVHMFKHETPDEFIEIVRKGERRGVRIPRRNYEYVSTFILEELKLKDGEILLSHLLDNANLKLGSMIRGDIYWYILNIKQHLEANRIIKSTVDQKRVQRITLLKKRTEKKV